MTSYLISGGSGTFGAAFVRRLLADNLSDRICIYSRGEHAQASLREALGEPATGGRTRWLIGDVRDQSRLRRAMQGVDVVVHAAALKRIEVGHYDPVEMVKTNIDGAINVIEAAQDAGVKKVVALSTDKAFEPCSPYGQSKALAEALFLAANNSVGSGGPKFSVVRYGNVWWSRGSVGPKWADQVKQGISFVNVSDPACTRFFMRIEEAVGLVLDTIRTMQGGEVNIPDLPAYAVGDLARAFGVDMQITGLPDFEKLHESMSDGKCSKHARRMSVDELRQAIIEADPDVWPQRLEAAE